MFVGTRNVEPIRIVFRQVDTCEPILKDLPDPFPVLGGGVSVGGALDQILERDQGSGPCEVMAHGRKTTSSPIASFRNPG